MNVDNMKCSILRQSIKTVQNESIGSDVVVRTPFWGSRPLLFENILELHSSLKYIFDYITSENHDRSFIEDRQDYYICGYPSAEGLGRDALTDRGKDLIKWIDMTLREEAVGMSQGWEKYFLFNPSKKPGTLPEIEDIPGCNIGAYMPNDSIVLSIFSSDRWHYDFYPSFERMKKILQGEIENISIDNKRICFEERSKKAPEDVIRQIANGDLAGAERREEIVLTKSYSGNIYINMIDTTASRWNSLMRALYRAGYINKEEKASLTYKYRKQKK